MAHKQDARSPAMTRKQTRRRRSRPTPRWLTGRHDLDQVAQRRCLMMLSVMSGEKPVSTAIEELGLSRGTYYQLETKALLAMLAALAPGADGATTPDAATAQHRIAELEAKVARLEQEKRRVERLLYLTRKVVPAGPLTTGRGRPPKSKPSGRPSTSGGPRPSLPSRKTRPKRTPSPPSLPSIPTPDGPTAP